MDRRTGVSPGLKVMVDRATRWKFAWQQSPLAACPQKVKDGVEDGTKVGGSRSPARSRRRQNWRNKSPRCVVHVGGVESSAHRTSYGPSGPDQRSFKTDVNFSNTLLLQSIKLSGSRMHFWQIKEWSLGRSATGTISKGAQLALLLCGLLGIGSVLLVSSV